MERRLRAEFEALFPAWVHVEHTHFWRGLACLSCGLVPFVGALDPARTVWGACAYHGNGVSMASWAGRAVADLIGGGRRPEDLPSLMTAAPKPFPAGAARGLSEGGVSLVRGEGCLAVTCAALLFLQLRSFVIFVISVPRLRRDDGRG